MTMTVRRWRSVLAGAALGAALLSCGTALTRQPPSAWAVSGEAVVEAPRETEFLLADRNGVVCVFSEGNLLANTGIPVRNLPRQDREQLEQGISARGEQELAALLEDLGA